MPWQRPVDDPVPVADRPPERTGRRSPRLGLCGVSVVHLGEQLVKGLVLVDGQGVEELVSAGAGSVADVLRFAGAGGGEAQYFAAPVGRVGGGGDQAAGGQLRDCGDDVAPVYDGVAGEVTLARSDLLVSVLSR